jgi:hypothetical protein
MRASRCGTDIGGGTSWSMLRTLDEGYKVLNLQGQRYHPLRSFYQATLGKMLFTNYLLPFEIVSILLLVAMVGVILLSKKDLK